MYNFKKVLAFLCSATLIVGSSVTAFATDPSSPTTPASGTTPATTTGGAGNIVAYSVETVTVPTAVKVSFNPQGWDFVIRGTGDDAVKAEAGTQIVSLNYGISSAATLDKKIKVSFTAAGTSGTGSKEVVFVNTAEEAQAKDDDNEKGAAPGEYKLYLAVAPSSAAVAKGWSTDDAAWVDFKVDDSETPKVSTVTSGLLGDVEMDAAEEGVQVFVDKKAELSYLLNKATYELVDDAEITFGTAQSAVAALMQPKALGSIVGFTFTGAMNPNADWTKANITALSITPTYEVSDADGTEETLTSDGAYQVIGGGAASALSASTISKSGGSITVTGKTVSGIVMTKNDNTTVNATSGTHYTKSGSTYTFTGSILNNKTKLTFKFDDNTSEDVTVQ